MRSRLWRNEIRFPIPSEPPVASCFIAERHGVVTGRAGFGRGDSEPLTASTVLWSVVCDGRLWRGGNTPSCWWA